MRNFRAIKFSLVRNAAKLHRIDFVVNATLFLQSRLKGRFCTARRNLKRLAMGRVGGGLSDRARI